jgi:hypothetical protein
MAGALDWLDSLTSGVGAIAGKAVDAAGQVAVIKATAAAKQLDQTPVRNTSPLQIAGGGSILPYVIGGVVLLVVGFLLLRKR